MSRSYEDLKVWQRAMDLVYVIYDITRAFPKDEMYGLVSQMRRAAVSIPSNIAEVKEGQLTRTFQSSCTTRAVHFTSSRRRFA